MYGKTVALLLVVLSMNYLGAAAPQHFNNVSAAFLNGKISTIVYAYSYNCTPGLDSIYPNFQNVSIIKNWTDCTVYGQNGGLYGTLPIWGITPAFAGSTTFGLDPYSSRLKYIYPIYGGNTIYTACGIGSTPAGCTYAPQYTYGAKSYLFEQLLGIYGGIVPYNGTGPKIPEGVLPFQPLDYILPSNYSNATTPWRIVFVRVFDPNIFPDATTGKCTRIAPSNLSNATGNCLTSFAALQRALLTKNAYIPMINANNPLWKVAGNASRQIDIGYANATINGVSALLYPNTNEYLFFSLRSENPYVPNVPESVNALLIEIIGAVVALVFLSNILWFYAHKEGRRPKSYGRAKEKG